MKRNEKNTFAHTRGPQGGLNKTPPNFCAFRGRPTGLFALRAGVPVVALAFCKYPVPGGRPSRRGRASRSTVLTLPTGRPRLRAPDVDEPEAGMSAAGEPSS
jgi:hypothetical protein